MTPAQIAQLLFGFGLEAAKMFSVSFGDIMAEFAKRHEVDGRPSDEAADEMDSHLSDR